MANNTTLPVGAGGDVIADEDIAGVKYQQVKLIDATATSTSPTGIAAKPLQVSLANTAANATAVKTDSSATTQPVSGTFWQATQPVSLATNTPTLQSGSTTAVTQATGTNLHTVIDSGTVSTVTNLSQLGGTAVAMNTGVRSAGTQRVTIATDDVLPAAQSGTWTVQPGNTANTTAWKVDGSAVTQPVSLTSTTVTGTVTVDTELPAAAALADSTANPTVPGVGGFNEVYATTAATWGRQRSIEHGQNTTGAGVTAAGLLAEFDDTSPTAVTENQFAPLRMSSRREAYTTIRDAAGNERGVNVTASNALTVDGSAVTQPVSLSGNQATNTVQLGGTAIDTNSGNKSAGTQRFVLATDQPNLTTPFNVNSIAQATGGYTPAKLISAATTNATVIKASAGTLGTLSVGNISASPRYVKFYNKATSPTVGTDVPVQVYVVPGNAAGAGTNIPLPAEGLNFSTGISLAITAGIADTDTTAVGANEVVVSYGTA